MSCPEGWKLQEWVDGRLSAVESAPLDTHVRGCAACGEESAEYRKLKARFKDLGVNPPTTPCPPPEVMSSYAAGTLQEPGKAEVLDHVSRCRACRDEWLEVQALLAEKPNSPKPKIVPRRPVRRLAPQQPPYGWIIAAAAALLLTVLGILTLTQPDRPLDPPGIVDTPESPIVPNSEETPAPITPEPSVEKPEPPKPPSPVPNPETPKPQPKPEPKPNPVQPEAPKPAPPTPAPDPTKPVPEKPAPVKPEPEPRKTRSFVKGVIAAIAGSPSTRLEGDAGWKRIRAESSREFLGRMEIRADLAPTKFRVGDHTYYLDRKTELSLAVEETGVRIRLAKGEAFFDVTPGRGAFVVEATGTTVTVKGTRFLVASKDPGAEVLVQEGRVAFRAKEASVDVMAGHLSVAAEGAPTIPAPAEMTDRLKWVRSLEEYAWIEAEQFARGSAMIVVPDRAASRGRALAVKGHNVPAQDATAAIRTRRKQDVRYAAWVRLHWPHGGASALHFQIHDAPAWTARNVPTKNEWQWVKTGTFSLPDAPFTLKLIDTAGGTRIDRILLTTDRMFDPSHEN